MRKRIFSFFVVLSVLLGVSYAGATDITDHFYSDATLTLAGSPYVVKQATAIVAGATVTIESGVEVQFDSGASLIVEGKLIAQGTASNKIIFKSSQSFSNIGAWEQILVKSSGNTFDYVEVRDSKFGIYQDLATNNITNSVFENNLYAMLFTNGGTSKVRNNIIQKNRNGILISGGVSEGTTYQPMPVINNNEFTEQSNLNIQLVNTSGDDLTDLTINARDNEWGELSLTEIQTRILDGLDNKISPIVDVSINVGTPAEIQIPAEGSTLFPTRAVSSNLENLNFRWNKGENVETYYLKIGRNAGGNDVVDSGVLTKNIYGILNLSLDGNPLYVRLSSLIDGIWVDEDYVYQTSVNKIFFGKGRGSIGFSSNSFAQDVNYNLEINFSVEEANPVVNSNNNTTRYDLTRKKGEVRFSGKATHQVAGETDVKVYEFDQVQPFDIPVTEGYMDVSASKELIIDFDVPAIEELPYLTHITYLGETTLRTSGVSSPFQVTFTMPSPWNNEGGVGNVYSAGNSGSSVFCSISLDIENSNLIPGEVNQVLSGAYGERTLQWDIIPVAGETAQAKVTADDSFGREAVISDVEGQGQLLLKITNPAIAGCQKTFPLYVGKRECASSDGICTFEERFDISNRDVVFDLGRMERGNSFGRMILKLDTPSAANATPQILQVYTFGKDSDVIYEGTAPRQIITPEVLVDIVPLDVFSYEIKYYALKDMGEKVNGVYEVLPEAIPLKYWKIENPDVSDASFDTLRITDLTDAPEQVAEYIWDEDLKEWRLNREGGLKIQTLREQVLSDSRVVTETTKDDLNTIFSEIQTTYRNIPNSNGVSEEVVEVVEDPKGLALTTITEWYEDSSDIGNFGNIKSIQYPDGSWVKYQYDRLGRKISEVSSYLNSPFKFPDVSAKAIYYDYTAQDESDSQRAEDIRRPRKVTEKILGQVVNQTFYVYSQGTENQRITIMEQAVQSEAMYGDEGNLRTVITYVSPQYDSFGPYPYTPYRPWKIRKIEYPDGFIDTYIYEQGKDIPIIDSNSFFVGEGTDVRKTTYHTPVNNPYPSGIAEESTAEAIVTNNVGEVLTETRSLYDGIMYKIFFVMRWIYDAYGHVTDTYELDLPSDPSDDSIINTDGEFWG